MAITRKTLIQLRSLLVRIADGDSDPPGLAKEAIAVIDRLIAQADKGGRGQAEVEYVVEDTVNGPALTERRNTGRAHPFRCPKVIYDAMVEVMALSERSMPLDEVIAGVGGLLGDQPPDYQVRVPLRLWMSVSPPLVVRMRARYKAADTKAFRKTAEKLWSDLGPR